MGIRKDAAAYGAQLRQAVNEQDFRNSASVVKNYARAIRRGVAPSVDQARASLKDLQKKRQFSSMTELAKAMLGGGVVDDEVRRRRGQALIERGRIGQALGELGELVNDPKTSEKELAEARGLTGRAWKQRYIDAAAKARAKARDLEKAVEEYRAVYGENKRKHTWHGINVVSLLNRAVRDGAGSFEFDATTEARRIASEILKTVGKKKRKTVWDLATAAEAHLALDNFDGARELIAEYVDQEQADSFELSSTYRQFVEVLQLESDPRAEPILGMLRNQILMRRGGAYLASHHEPSAEKASEILVFLIRVARADWRGDDIDGLVVTSRLGNILSCRGTQRTVDQLVEDQDVVSIEGSRPGGSSETARSLEFTHVVNNGARLAETGDQALVAIIDSGIDILHEAFLDGDGNSRIVRIWDQTDDTGPAAGAPYGTVHSAEDIARYLQTGMVPGRLGGLQHRQKHGTHVASIAAGRAAGAFSGGVAPGAMILFVVSKLEPEEGMPRSTGYSTSHSDALDFIDRTAAELGLPVVVNLSQGQNAGAHDGRSLLEAAFDTFSGMGRTPGRIVVKSAGNERDAGGHAKVTMQPDSVEDLMWTSTGDFRFEDVLELWCPSNASFEVRLHDPNGQETPWLSASEKLVSGQLPGGAGYGMTYQRYHDDNGDSNILISIKPGADLKITAGTWTLEIKSSTGGELHAWVERGPTRALKFANHFDENMTLSIPGTATTVITVGAVESTRIKVGSFSSYGPTRDGREKPDVSAPGVGIKAADAGTTTGVRAEDGTSMAAPHVTGAIALLLSRQKKSGGRRVNAAIAAQLLRQTTRNHSGQWDRGQGYGVVDVKKLLDADLG